jgi:hypothetical protein
MTGGSTRPIRSGLTAAVLAGLLVMAAVGSAGAASPSPPATINITLTGDGTGRVTTADGFIDCRRADAVTTGTCSHSYSTTNGPVAYSITDTPQANSLTCSISTCSTVGGVQGGVLNGGNYVGYYREFRLQDGRTVTVAMDGAGTGTVMSTPGGIACPGDCDAIWSAGGSITLKAVPASGSAFSSWSGACAGQGATCTFNVPAAVSVITATFAKKATPAPTKRATPKPTPRPPTAPPSPTPVPSVEPSVEPTPLPPTALPPPTAAAIASESPAEPAASSGSGGILVGLVAILVIGLGLAAWGGYATMRRRSGA